MSTKRRLRPSVIASLLLLMPITCAGIDKFTITESDTTTIDGAGVLTQLVPDMGFGDFANMSVSENQTLQNQGVKKNQIDSVYVRSIILKIVDPPQGQDFSFLDSLEFYVESEGLEKKLIASGADFEAGVTEIGLDIEDVNLRDYVSAESMDITTNASGTAPENDTTIEGEITLEVDVDVDGAICGS